MSNELSQDEALVQEFVTESEELLQRMDEDLVTLESAPHDADLLNRIFRAMHTIKGTSSFLGYDQLVEVTHHAEDVLNAMRRGEISATRRIMDALLKTCDQVRRMLADIKNKEERHYEIAALIAGLASSGTLEAAEAAPAPATAESPAEADKTCASTEIAQPKTEEAKAPRHDRRQEDSTASTMRVDVRKLDDLINLVGELVLERNRLARLSYDLGAQRVSAEQLQDALSQSTARLGFITDELQAASLKTRMVPIETVFRKFPRMVRDVATTMGKDVELVIRGQETELDKTMVEQIGDPLVHLVRNSLDHGIESPAAREAAGKTRVGTLRLEARQEGDQIVVCIVDDGAGIDPQRIANKAIDKGLVTVETVRAMSRQEILELIFLPGFSTAEVVNNISGRGVGMDVVRTNLKKLNGTIDIDTDPGRGTTIQLKIPLTMAILPVLMVQVSDEIYALPLRSVIETVRIQREDIHCADGQQLLRLRDGTLPLVHLGEIFAVPKADRLANTPMRVVVLSIGGKRVALMVDRLVGQESTVVKPLGSYLKSCTSIAGATISGDGQVRLVLDPGTLISSMHENTSKQAVC